MRWKQLLDDAFQKGERVKEDILVELVHSKLFSELVKNERFVQAVTSVIRTKDEIAKVLHKQINQVLSFIDMPTRDDVEAMNRRLTQLAHEIDRVGQRTRIHPLSHSLTRHTAPKSRLKKKSKKK